MVKEDQSTAQKRRNRVAMYKTGGKRTGARFYPDVANKIFHHASKVIDFRLERLRVNLGVQIWLDGPGFSVRSNYESTHSSMNHPYLTVSL